ncbi:hypothetical protein ACOZ4F_04305 [Haloarcula marismortui]|uniref:DUF5789 family protein n=1 Tax=Haloarcula marismortui TaxID=2238 RepID=UPI003C70CA4B
MSREVKLNEALLETATYPLSVATARQEFENVRLVYADGTEPLAAVLDRVEDEQFDSPDEAQSSIYNSIPAEGVGEPGQSGGEG